MPTSPAAARVADPSMLGQTHYARIDEDFYPTEPRASLTLPKRLPHLFSSFPANRVKVWEPACGDGAIVKALSPFADFFASDIKAYPGFEADRLIDFLSLSPADLPDIFGGALPDGIVTNPPYRDLAATFARKALELMAPSQGFVAMFCRQEWSCAGKRADLFDHPYYYAKVNLRFRPRWIADSTGSPRFNYSWYVWDFEKDPTVPAHDLYVS